MNKKEQKSNLNKYNSTIKKIDEISSNLWQKILNFIYLIVEFLEMIFCLLLMLPHFILPIYQAGAFNTLIMIGIFIMVIFLMLKPLIFSYTSTLTFIIVLVLCANIGAFNFAFALFGAIVIGIYVFKDLQLLINLYMKK